jgi:hypothetical protein
MHDIDKLEQQSKAEQSKCANVQVCQRLCGDGEIIKTEIKPALIGAEPEKNRKKTTPSS